jgi:ADP-ribosylglycohydrolase
MAPTPVERLRGAIWGVLVGDAAGVPYEFREPEAIGTFRFGIQGVVKIDPAYAHQVPAGTWSDDGALTLALLDSLLPAAGRHGLHFDLADQGRRFRAWYETGAYTPDGVCFDIGSTTRAALEALARGVSAKGSGQAGERNQSNGALMRILPLALVPASIDTAALVRQASQSSAVTHAHPLCRTAAALHVLAARHLFTDPRRDSAAAGAARALAGAHRELLTLLGPDGFAGITIETLVELEAWPSCEGRGHIADALWSAWRAFTPANNYSEVIERAVAYGHDTDTTAAIAGGLGGIWWGESGIPAAWRSMMRGPAVVEPLLARLVGAWGPDDLTGDTGS